MGHLYVWLRLVAAALDAKASSADKDRKKTSRFYVLTGMPFRCAHDAKTRGTRDDIVCGL